MRFYSQHAGVTFGSYGLPGPEWHTPFRLEFLARRVWSPECLSAIFRCCYWKFSLQFHVWLRVPVAFRRREAYRPWKNYTLQSQHIDRPALIEKMRKAFAASKREDLAREGLFLTGPIGLEEA